MFKNPSIKTPITQNQSIKSILQNKTFIILICIIAALVVTVMVRLADTNGGAYGGEAAIVPRDSRLFLSDNSRDKIIKAVFSNDEKERTRNSLVGYELHIQTLNWNCLDFISQYDCITWAKRVNSLSSSISSGSIEQIRADPKGDLKWFLGEAEYAKQLNIAQNKD
jgi:hypothetical protein